MTIKIILSSTGHDIRVIPETAIVKQGEEVSWSVHSPPAPIRKIQWEVIFEDDSPFGDKDEGTHDVTTDADPTPGEHDGNIEPGPATEPGEYKYGIRVIDPAANFTFIDEDPYLVVRP